MSQFLDLLYAANRGQDAAGEALYRHVYDDLRRMANARLSREKPGQTLQPTALVHEAYLRLLGSANSVAWANRQHFFAAAAEAMRRILVEAARRKSSLKHGGDRQRSLLEPEHVAAPELADDLIELDDALQKLEATEPNIAQVVKLRYFSGLTVPETAEALGVAPRTVDNYWAYAKAWLQAEMDR